MRHKSWPLWFRWVVANALAEMLGLGATFAVGVLIVTRLGDPRGLAAIGMMLLMTVSGVLEGLVVGLLQWAVLRQPFPQVTRHSWLVATLVGALVAWFLGSLPATLMDMGADRPQASAQEPETWVMLAMAAAMGLFLGLILGVPQWRVLRHAVDKAWVWLPANSAAWALGMPIIFGAVDRAYQAATVAGSVATMALALALTGAVVGAVHGVALVWLAARVKGNTGGP
ncbi:MAG: hypothetical protein JSV36_00070 [Anaerolineae bacterium]|nr:MAG: hypothetical protein JSV36_00070 [Anaerolineae bacterium]